MAGDSLAPTPLYLRLRSENGRGQSQFRVWIEEDTAGISERLLLILIKASGRLYLNAEMDLQEGNVPIGLATDETTHGKAAG